MCASPRGKERVQVARRSVAFGGIVFRGLTRDSLFTHDGRLKHIVTINAEGIVLANENPRFREVVNRGVACFDGQIPVLLARRKFGRHIEKLSGSDLIFDFSQFAVANGYKIFLLGATERSNSLACEALRKRFGALVEGYAPPALPYPFTPEVDGLISQRLASYGPHVLLVSFGMPKQELWIHDHSALLTKLGVNWAIGVGGAFDFAAGIEIRAPKPVQRIGLEGIWRLVQRPSRAKRFLRVFRMFRYLSKPEHPELAVSDDDIYEQLK
jgi:N-acetylglucosaminyldiphosphoundecaprenol N-acetyl-beta-D-mannosaminyltransferase